MTIVSRILQEILESIVQVIIITFLVLASLVISFYARQIATGELIFSSYVWEGIWLDSLLTAVVSMGIYKFGRTGIVSLTALFAQEKKPFTTEQSKLVSFLLTLFITVAFVVSSQPLRPVLQHTILDSAEPYVTIAYVRYDVLPTILILLVLAAPIVLIAVKKASKPQLFTTIAFMLLFGSLSAFLNASPNYFARVYETRESWILRDWDKQASQAEQALQSAETVEDQAAAYYWLGVAANRNKNFQQAVDYQMEAIRLMPTYGAAYSSLSMAHRMLGNFPLALEFAQQCERFTPEYAWCYYAYGSVYAEMGFWDQALIDFKKASELSAHDEELREEYERSRDLLSSMDAADQRDSSRIPPGCSSVPVVNEQNQFCTGKNKAVRFSNTIPVSCLDVENDNCFGAGATLINNCPAQTRVVFDGVVLPPNQRQFFRLAQSMNEEIVYGVGSVDDAFFTVSYTQTAPWCQ